MDEKKKPTDQPAAEEPVEETTGDFPSYEDDESLDATMVDINVKPSDFKKGTVHKKDEKIDDMDRTDLNELLKKQKSLSSRLGISNIFKKKKDS